MKKLASLLSLLCCMSTSFYAQYVGIGTENPTAMLDINGDVVFRTSDMTMEDSITLALDVNTERFSCYRISGADSAFTLAGMTAGMDGRVVTLINESGFPMEMNHDDTTAAPEDRILTGNHEDLVLEEMGMVTLQYDTSAQKWLVNSSNQIPAGADVWDTTGTNIFFDNYVGIGTEEPTAPLTIETEPDEIGFSHSAGDVPITLASSISDLAASIGTTTDNIFSLKAGGTGKVHIFPTSGNVLIGAESAISNMTGNHPTRDYDFNSKLTVMTGMSEIGFKHIGGDNEIIVAEAIGGESAVFGTTTNHMFSLMTNGTEKFNLTPEGNVGIGITTPTSPLSFPNLAGKKISLWSNGPDADFGFSIAGGILQMHTAGTDRISFGSGSGNAFTERVAIYTGTGLIKFPDVFGSKISFWGNAINADYGISLAAGSLNIHTAGTDKIAFGSGSGNAFIERLAVHTGTGLLKFPNAAGTKISFWSNGPNLDYGIGIGTGALQLFTAGFDRIGFGHMTGGVFNETMTFLSGSGQLGIGTANLGAYKLAVNGSIRAKEIVVESGWADYVFDEKYTLLPLHEIELFIKENKHLPGIPSAREIESAGLNVADMQTRMMEKIEELTLHIIALNKRIEELEQTNQD